jgi:hypothetical protein
MLVEVPPGGRNESRASDLPPDLEGCRSCRRARCGELTFWLPRLGLAVDKRRADDDHEQFGQWYAPSSIAEVASTFSDYHPAISRHGLSLYFTSDRDAQRFKTEIMGAQRSDGESPWDVTT